MIPACNRPPTCKRDAAARVRGRIWDDGRMASPRREVFRLPGIALIFPALLWFCVVPLASLGGWWLLMYLVPVVGLAWILLTRTVADEEGLRVGTLRGRQTLGWDTIEHLELDGPRWLVAVQRNGRRSRLPMVLPRDLPRLSVASDGALDFRMPGPDDTADDARAGESEAGPAA